MKADEATTLARVAEMREAGPAWVRLTLLGEDWSTVLGYFEQVEIVVSREWATDIRIGSVLSIRIAQVPSPTPLPMKLLRTRRSDPATPEKENLGGR